MIKVYHRVVAFVLAIAMVVAGLPPVSVSATSNINSRATVEGDLGISFREEIIPEDLASYASQGGLAIDEGNWSGVKIPFNNNNYELSYYVVITDDNYEPAPMQVVHNISKISETDYEVTTNFYSAADTPREVYYAKYNADLTTWQTPLVAGDPITTITEVIDTNNDSGSIREHGGVYKLITLNSAGNLNTTQTGYYEWRFMIDTNADAFVLTTNGVQAGTKMEFSVDSRGINDTIYELRELGNLSVLPTHYWFEESDDGKYEVIDAKEIELPYVKAGLVTNVGNLTDIEGAGGRPGLQLKFEHPNEIYTAEDGTFQYRNLDNLRATTIPMVELLDGNYEDTQNISIEFDLSEATQEGVMIEVSSNDADEEGIIWYDEATNMYTLDIVKEDTLTDREGDSIIGTEAEVLEYEKRLFEWDRLESSMILRSFSIDVREKDKSISVPALFSTSNGIQTIDARTYLEFNISRANDSQTYIQYKPYASESTGSSDTYKLLVNGLEDGTYTGNNVDRILISPVSGSQTSYELQVNSLVSQAIIYKPVDDDILPPPVPLINATYDAYALTNISDPSEVETMGFDMSWAFSTSADADLLTSLESKNLFYEMFLYKEADGLPLFSKIFRVYSEDTNGDGTKEIHIEDYLATEDSLLEVYYDTREELFIASDIQVKRIDIPGLIDIEGYNNILDSEAYMREDEYPDSSQFYETAGSGFEVPATYYISLRGIYEDKAAAGNLQASSESMLSAVTFDYLTELIPTVPSITHNLIIEDDESYTQQITFEIVTIEDYVETILVPSGWHTVNSAGEDADNNRTYELFLYQETDLVKEEGYGNDDLDEIDVTTVYENEYKKLAVELDSSDLATLRNGGILGFAFDDDRDYNPVGLISNSILTYFSNLDENQIYYIQMRTKVNSERDIEPYAHEDISIPTKVYSFTTYVAPEGPSLAEQRPAAPENFQIKEDDDGNQELTSTTVVLDWDKPETLGHDVTYEVMRLFNAKVDDANLDATLTLAQIQEREPDVVTYDNITESEFMDTGLTPNKIYYYYLRTVLEIDGEVAYSEWLLLPVTTRSLEAPENLQVRTTAEYDYDTQHEVVISFESPLPIEGDYSLEIAIKSQSDDDYTLNTDNQFEYTIIENPDRIDGEEEEAREGYTFYDYHITGLRSAQRYDIKVRLIETKEDGTQLTSLYSNRVTFRTDYDEDEAETDSWYDDYLDWYDTQTELYKRNPYWEMKAKGGESVYKYRNEYFQTEVAVNPVYELVQPVDVDKITYYFPSASLDRATYYNSQLEVSMDDYILAIRPDTINDDTGAIIDAQEDVADKKTEDYTIKLELELKKMVENVANGAAPLLPTIGINFTVVNLSDEEEDIEDKIMIEALALIEAGRYDILEAYENTVRTEVTEEEVAQIAYDKYDEVVAAHKAYITELYEDLVGTEYDVDDTEEKMLLSANVDSYSALGYQLQSDNSWKAMSTFRIGLGYAFEFTTLGTYVFGGIASDGSLLAIPTLPVTYAVISQYQLNDFFDMVESNMQYSASRRATYGAIARVLDAPTSVDAPTYLQSKGIQGVRRVGLDDAITLEETIYLMMQLYEKLNREDVSNYAVKNSYVVTNIDTFQPQYVDYIYAAVQLKFVYPVGGQIDGTQTMTINDVLEFLQNVIP